MLAASKKYNKIQGQIHQHHVFERKTFRYAFYLSRSKNEKRTKTTAITTIIKK